MTHNKNIPSNWKLPEVITNRLGSSAGKQRVIAEDGHILVVLHKIPGKDDNHRETLFLWRDTQNQWHSSERGNGLGVLTEHLDKYSKLEEKLDQQYEEAAVSGDYFDLLEMLAPVQRTIKNTSTTLQTAREIAGSEIIDYRDRAEELQRSFDLLYIDCKNGLEYAIAKKAEEQSELQKQALNVGHRLNIIMALFLPVTAAASLLGMNVPHGLETSSPWVFASIVGFFGILGLLMKSWVTKKS
jgi:Mg2+ and Co2+ transporter CorA